MGKTLRTIVFAVAMLMSLPVAAQTKAETRYVYDNLDRLTHVQTMKRETVYEYDELGNRTGKKTNAAVTLTTEYAKTMGKVTLSAAFRVEDDKYIDYTGSTVLVNVKPAEDCTLLQILAESESSSEDITNTRSFELKAKSYNVKVRFVDTAIEAVEAGNLSIEYNPHNMMLTISDAKADTPCAVYSADGRLIAKGRTDSQGREQIKIRQHGVFVVQVGAATRKLSTVK